MYLLSKKNDTEIDNSIETHLIDTEKIHQYPTSLTQGPSPEKTQLFSTISIRGDFIWHYIWQKKQYKEYSKMVYLNYTYTVTYFRDEQLSLNTENDKDKIITWNTKKLKWIN